MGADLDEPGYEMLKWWWHCCRHSG